MFKLFREIQVTYSRTICNKACISEKKKFQFMKTFQDGRIYQR